MTDDDDRDRLEAFDRAVKRIYEDSRMPPGTREVALAMAYALERAPRPPDGPKYWTVVRRTLGVDNIGRPRLSQLIADDAPRYERPNHWWNGACEGPRVRPYKPVARPEPVNTCVRGHHPHLGNCKFPEVYSMGVLSKPDDHTEGGTICGAHATIRVPEVDMVTGWVTIRWFCTRHKERAREVKEQLAARGTPPPPIPNTGGVLTRHFAADWKAVYQWHCEKVHRRWEPPVYGLDPDEWGKPGHVVVPKRPRLALVVTDPLARDAKCM